MFAARFVTAIALLALFCAGLLLLPTVYWGAVLLAGLVVAAWEWAALVRYRPGARLLFVATVTISGIALLFHPRASPLQAPLYSLSVAFWIAVAPPWLFHKWRPVNVFAVGATGWIVLVPTWLALTMLQKTAAELLAMLAIVWIADTAAYLFGRRFGRHHLAPQISPGKTWEGLIGAALAVAVYYSLLWLIFGAERTLPVVLGGLVLFGAITAMSVEGDLFESWMKRQAGVKDSGSLLPGHGGILDRIDGLTAAMPLAALWLHYFGRSGVL